MRTERLTRNATAPATVAFVGLLAFLFIVYANPGNWFDGLEDIGFAKIAAGFSLAALFGSWILYNRRLTIGGAQGWTLLALFALVGFSSTWSYWPKYTFDTFADGLKYLAVFFLVANVVDSQSRLATTMRVLALASCIPAFGAIWSHAHGEHLVEGDRAGWIGIFANPNDLAYHLVVGVAMLLAAADSATRACARPPGGRSWRRSVTASCSRSRAAACSLRASSGSSGRCARSSARRLILGAACVVATVCSSRPTTRGRAAPRPRRRTARTSRRAAASTPGALAWPSPRSGR